jgi:RNA polymerase sigma-70 factor, ECF subfamily
LTRFFSRFGATDKRNSYSEAWSPDDADSDDALARSVARGDQGAMATLYDRHAALIYRYALRVGGDVSIAEEVTQDVFLAVLRQANQFDSRRALFSTWLCAIARRLVWRQFQRRQRLVPLDADTGAEDSIAEAENPDIQLTRKETVELVRRGIDALPLQMKEVIILCELEEMPYEDVAVVLGIPVGTVRSRLHRAKRRLAQFLENASQSPGKEHSTL